MGKLKHAERPTSPVQSAALKHGGEKLPVLVFLYLALGFVAADLLVERVEKLLARGRLSSLS